MIMISEAWFENKIQY